MPIATNPDTGEVVYADENGQWQPAKTAVNPQTKEMHAFDGKEWLPVTVQSKGVLNYIDDVARALALGATFGFADKIAAKADELTGRGGTYEQNLAKEKAQSAAIPGAIKVPGEIAGSVASMAAAAPVTGAAAAITGASRLPAIIRAAGSGAGVGALSGAGNADEGHMASGAATGAAVGAGVGAAAQPIISGIGAVAAPVISTIRGAINPTGEAARRVGSAIQRDTTAGDVGLTPSQFAGATAEGAPTAIADMGGETTRALARSAANTSPEARAVLTNFANDRFEGQTDRAVKFVQGIIGAKGDIGEATAALHDAARAANKPAYTAAYQAGDKPIWSPELERLSGSPTVLGAMKGAESKWKDWQILDGFGAANPPAKVENGVINFGNGKGLATFPNIQYWDYTARDLAAKAQTARASGNMQDAARYGGLERAIKTELDKIVPEFGDARKGAAGFFGAENALEAGQKFLSSTVDVNDARRVVAKMSPADRELFKFGFAGEFINKISAVPDRADITKRIANSKDDQTRIDVALGPDAKRMSSFLDVEAAMSKLKEAVTENSTTARQLVELGLAGGTLGYGEMTSDPSAMTKAALVYGLLRGQRAIDQRVVNKVADLLVSSDPTQLLKGVEMVTKSAALGDSIRRIATRGIVVPSVNYETESQKKPSSGFFQPNPAALQ